MHTISLHYSLLITITSIIIFSPALPRALSIASAFLALKCVKLITKLIFLLKINEVARVVDIDNL